MKKTIEPNILKATKHLLGLSKLLTPERRMKAIAILIGEDITSDVSIAEAAAYLGMSRTTLWRMCCRGEIVSVRRGKKIYIAGCEVARLKMDAA